MRSQISRTISILNNHLQIPFERFAIAEDSYKEFHFKLPGYSGNQNCVLNKDSFLKIMKNVNSIDSIITQFNETRVYSLGGDYSSDILEKYTSEVISEADIHVEKFKVSFTNPSHLQEIEKLNHVTHLI